MVGTVWWGVLHSCGTSCWPHMTLRGGFLGARQLKFKGTRQKCAGFRDAASEAPEGPRGSGAGPSAPPPTPEEGPGPPAKGAGGWDRWKTPATAATDTNGENSLGHFIGIGPRRHWAGVTAGNSGSATTMAGLVPQGEATPLLCLRSNNVTSK